MDWLTWEAVTALAAVVLALTTVVGVCWTINQNIVKAPCKWVAIIVSRLYYSLLEWVREMYRLYAWGPYWSFSRYARSKAIEDYKRELSDYCRKRSESAKQCSRRVVLAPIDIWDSVGIVMLVEMKYGMAGQSDAYRDLVCYLQEPEMASPPVEHYSYAVTADATGCKELFPVDDEDLRRQPPVLSEEQMIEKSKEICWSMQKLVWPPWK